MCDSFYLLFVPGERCEGEVKAIVNNIKISRQGTGEARQRRFINCYSVMDFSTLTAVGIDLKDCEVPQRWFLGRERRNLAIIQFLG